MNIEENKTKPGNPLWKVGTSGNPHGRPKLKNSVRSIKGMVERFVKRNITPNRLQKMYDALTENQKLEMLTMLLPYVMAKPASTADTLTPEEIDALYAKLELKLTTDAAKKAS